MSVNILACFFMAHAFMWAVAAGVTYHEYRTLHYKLNIMFVHSMFFLYCFLSTFSIGAAMASFLL